MLKTHHARRSLLGATAVAVLLGTTACQSSDAGPSPAEAALAYLEALAAGDAAAANALTTGASADSLPADDSLEGADPITGIDVGEIGTVSEHTTSVEVPVSYEVTGAPHETTIELQRDGEGWLVGRGLEQEYTVRWTGFTSQSSANWGDLTEVALGGTAIGDRYDETGVLYPGVYGVTTDLGPYAVLETETVAVAPPDAASYTQTPIEIAVAPSEPTLAEVTTSLTDHLDTELDRHEGERPNLYIGFSSDEAMQVWDDLMAAERDGATFAASVVEPIEVTWQPEDGIWPVGTATILVSWNGPSGSGEHELTVATEGTWAEATLETLEVTPGLWHVLD